MMMICILIWFCQIMPIVLAKPKHHNHQGRKLIVLAKPLILGIDLVLPNQAHCFGKVKSSLSKIIINAKSNNTVKGGCFISQSRIGIITRGRRRRRWRWSRSSSGLIIMSALSPPNLLSAIEKKS